MASATTVENVQGRGIYAPEKLVVWGPRPPCRVVVSS